MIIYQIEFWHLEKDKHVNITGTVHDSTTEPETVNVKRKTLMNRIKKQYPEYTGRWQTPESSGKLSTCRKLNSDQSKAIYLRMIDEQEDQSNENP